MRGCVVLGTGFNVWWGMLFMVCLRITMYCSSAACDSVKHSCADLCKLCVFLATAIGVVLLKRSLNYP